MNKIIQFLRLSRLVLLVILLLFAVAAKIARAETAELWTTLHCQADVSYSQKSFASPQAVVDTCFPRSYLGPRDPERGFHQVFSEHHQAHASVWPVRKTCDAKELTNPNPPFGYESLKDLFILKAPQGDDAALWFPDKFSSCENNCVVRNTRYYTKGKDGVPKASVTEADGSSRSVFYKRQTGEVCVPEKPKKNDPPKPPASDNDNGGSQGNSGSDNGQGNQSNGSGGESSSGGTGSGSGSTSNSGSGNSDGGGSGSGGSGSGSGGVNGSGGQTGPSGGGTSGGESGGNESSGSEDEAGGESDGSGEESGGSGDSGGQGGANSGGQGNVGGDSNNGQDGQPGGTGEGQGNGEGDGQGSISGGSCEANQAPDCKGDPIQCYIAREQWRTACAASGQSNTVETEGNCESNTPPKCKGDAVQCYMAKQQWQQGCAAAAAQSAIGEITEYGKGQQGYLDDLANEGNPDGILDGIQTDTIDLVGKLNTGLVKLPNACPTFPPIDLGVYGKYDIDTNDLCSVLRTLGRIFLAMSYIWAFGIIVRAM